LTSKPLAPEDARPRLLYPARLSNRSRFFVAFELLTMLHLLKNAAILGAHPLIDPASFDPRISIEQKIS
jgi:hypothetical protein